MRNIFLHSTILSVLNSEDHFTYSWRYLFFILCHLKSSIHILCLLVILIVGEHRFASHQECFFSLEVNKKDQKELQTLKI